jgi:hypothetical protein
LVPSHEKSLLSSLALWPPVIPLEGAGEIDPF